MFTIKHIDSRGNEFAIEAESYEVAFDHSDNLMRVMTYDHQYRDGSYTGLWAGIPHDHAGPDTDSIYVMNSKGATVAKHHFAVHPADHYNQLCADDIQTQAA